MFKKLLASIGVGGAKVDTQLDNPRLYPGDVLRGKVVVQGGKAAQDIEKIELVLMIEAEDDSNDDTRVNLPLGSLRVSQTFTIRAEERREFPFEIQLPADLPINGLPYHGQPLPIWIHTDLAIDAAIDTNDRDFLEILPPAPVSTLLQAFDQLGWGISSTDVELGTARVGHVSSTLGCYQEIELRPRGGSFRIQEIELTFLPYGNETHVLIEVDSRFGSDFYASLVMGPDFAHRDWVNELRMQLPL